MQDKVTRFKVSDADPRSVENTATGQLAGFPSEDSARVALRILQSGKLHPDDLFWRDPR